MTAFDGDLAFLVTRFVGRYAFRFAVHENTALNGGGEAAVGLEEIAIHAVGGNVVVTIRFVVECAWYGRRAFSIF